MFAKTFTRTPRLLSNLNRSFKTTTVSRSPYFSRDFPISSEELIQLEKTYAARNYEPLPVVFTKAEGVNVWDPEGKKYLDFLSAYCAVNQGHCHPKIVNALITQAQQLTLSSRAFYNDMFPRFSKFVHEYFGYDMILPMNTGAEGVETALKLARKWAYVQKGVSEGQAVIVSVSHCFHGRTLGVISLSNDPVARDGFGPFLPNVQQIPYNDLNAVEELFDRIGDQIAGFLVEPIQGEAGVVVPDPGYLKGVSNLCKKHNILLIADEVQTGLGRTGKKLASDWEQVRPDLVILGKAISGGVYPLSGVLADEEVMLCIGPGQHGSTYGGNPLASAVGIAALQVLRDENLSQNALVRGAEFRSFGADLMKKFPNVIKQVRGKGLLNAFVIDDKVEDLASKICYEMKEKGVLAKYTQDTVIRFAPPLVISKEQLEDGMNRISDAISSVSRSL